MNAVAVSITSPRLHQPPVLAKRRATAFAASMVQKKLVQAYRDMLIPRWKLIEHQR